MPRCGLPGQLSLQAPVASAPPVSPRPYPASPGPFPAFPRRAPLWPAPSGTCPFCFRPSRRSLSGILRPARFIFLPHAVRRAGFPAVLLKLAAFGLRAIVARRTVLPGILVLKPQTSGWCGGRSFPFSRSGAIAPGILRRPRPLKIPFVRFLFDDVSLLSVGVPAIREAPVQSRGTENPGPMWPEAYRSASLPDGAFFSGSVWTFLPCSRMVCKIEGFF